MVDDQGTGGGVSHVLAGSGRSVWMAGDTYTFKATAESTNARLTLFEASVPPGAGPPPHTHAREHEAYYVLAGELEVLDGERTFTARADDFVVIPPGTLLRFRNPGVDAARMLILFTPAGIEGFFFEAGEAARPGEPAPQWAPDEIQRALEIERRYGTRTHLPDADPGTQEAPRRGGTAVRRPRRQG